MSKKKKILLITVVAIILFIRIAYAYLSQYLSSNVKVTVPNYQPLCQRANSPHTETCERTSSGCYADGFSQHTGINYGQFSSTRTGVLKSGAAFNCDINGDGTYNTATERFYYVTDLDTDNNVAVLVYYSTVYGGEVNKANSYLYGTFTGGPTTARAQLPKTSQWTNVTLAKTSKRIRAENDYTSVMLNTQRYNFPQSFSYSGYAARLITYQEINKACGGTITSTGGLKNCNYLLEGTIYTNSNNKITHILTQTPTSTSNIMTYAIDVSSRRMASLPLTSQSGVVSSVKPVIEVPKSRMVY